MSKAFFPSIHAFRGFAIINIVAIHAIEFIFYFAGTSNSLQKPDLTPFAWADRTIPHCIHLSGSSFNFELSWFILFGEP